MTTGENCPSALGLPHMERTMECAMWGGRVGSSLGSPREQSSFSTSVCSSWQVELITLTVSIRNTLELQDFCFQ